jgi:hypothetical protein
MSGDRREVARAFQRVKWKPGSRTSVTRRKARATFNAGSGAYSTGSIRQRRYLDLGSGEHGARREVSPVYPPRPSPQLHYSNQASTHCTMISLRAPLTGLLLAILVTPLTAVSISQFNLTYTEDFDTLAAVTSSSLPPGWALSETGSSANDSYGAGTGSSTTGNTYSFGGSGSTDRALGALRTSGVASTFGTVVTNDTGGTLTQITIQFTGEQWRLGALGRTDRLDFSYSLDGTSITTGTWMDVDALDFTGPITAGTIGALDGNVIDHQLLMTHTLTGLNLVSGASLWLRWVDFDASGSDDGLAIDSISLLAAGQFAGGTENVPDSLPMSVIVAAFGALMMVAARIRRTNDAVA